MNATELKDELARHEGMTLEELRSTWIRLTKAPAPKVSAGLLRLALAHHLQSKALGGVTAAMERQLQQLAAGPSAFTAQPGVRLVREWRGMVHVVTVSDAGRYRWRDRDWNSLSEIARTITGTRWSGPAFFGTKARRAA